MSLLLLLALHAGPVPAIKPLAVLAGGGLVLVSLPTPAGMHWPSNDLPEFALGVRRSLEQAARPRLEGDGFALEWLGRDPGGIPTLEFVGFVSRVKGPLPAWMTLRYHSEGPVASVPRSALVRLAGVEVRKEKAATLEALWRRAIQERLAAAEVLSGGHGYFAFARKGLAALHKTAEVPSLLPADAPSTMGGLFELASGAVSLDEALALGRIKPTHHGIADRRTPLGEVRAVTVADHPWKDMLKGAKPTPEPLADAVPHDNWYFRATKLSTLADLAAATSAWGGSPLRMAQMNERDHRLLDRYQGKLCLPLAEMVKSVPAKYIRGVALTGSDLFWAEGTDVTVIVDTPRPKTVIWMSGGPLLQARKLPGFKSRPHAHGAIPIEGYTTPDRAVSLYRTMVGERAIFSNSLPAMRRVLDTIAGERPSLSKSLDFQYMRTVFPRDDKQEDGFVFLSDAFFRALVGPETRIKAMRRLSTRAALTNVSHAALLHASVEGKFPADAAALVKAAYLPWPAARDSESDHVRWARGEASSPTMGTLSAGVPLIDLSMNKVTKEEASAYDAFRVEYERLWGRFMDPAGIRFHGDADRMRVEAHMLPLTNNPAYEGLRWMSGGKETPIDAAKLAPAIAGQMRISFLADGWMALQLDDFPGLPRWAAHQMARLAYPEKKMPPPGIPPVTMVWGGPKGEKHARWIAGLLDTHLDNGPLFLRKKETTRNHRGVTITRVPVSPKAYAAFIELLARIPAQVELSPLALLPVLFPREQAPAAFYTARIGDGWYTGLDEKALLSRIDAWKKGADEKGDPAAAGLHLSSRRPSMSATLGMVLESQARHKALAANVMWQALHDAGVITPAMKDEQRREVALRLWGFIPAAPDGTASVWDKATRQVLNSRHGTWSSPAAHIAPDARSPLARFVRGFETLTADMRFREDGLHAVVTFGHVK